jgi:putative ABC transport system ATP-binding protein
MATSLSPPLNLAGAQQPGLANFANLPSATTPRIDLHDVSKSYRVGEVAITALDNVNLHVGESSLVVILGPSGSGKTTLLNIVGSLDSATSGQVMIGGVDLSLLSRSKRFDFRRTHISFIFQTFNLLPGLTASENVQVGADLAGQPSAAERAGEMLQRVGLGDRLRHFPHQLSGGEQQRVAIARALATGNPILLADEPTGELDFRTGIQILELLKEQTDSGLTVLLVTHNREISRIADRVVEMSSGRIVRDGPPVGGKATVAELQW